MTSVPKPLKFLRSHYKEMKDLYESIPAQNRNKPGLADIISVMAITSGKEGERESLQFRCGLVHFCVLSASDQYFWGHAYRHVAADCWGQMSKQVLGATSMYAIWLVKSVQSSSIGKSRRPM